MIETVHDNIGLYKKIENTNISINNKWVNKKKYN